MCTQLDSRCQCHCGTRQLLIIFCCCVLWTAAVSNAEGECYVNGEEIQLNCHAPKDQISIVEWRSMPPTQAGFFCSSDSTVDNHTISLRVICDGQGEPDRGTCGSYVGTVNCSTFISTLTFSSSYSSMNGHLILCRKLYAQERSNQLFPIKIGIVPDPPINASLSYPEPGVYRYDWLSPEGFVTGGILGYNISHEGNCGVCLPEGVVSNTTFTATCSGWIPNGQNCSVYIQTVTADCTFGSDPAILYSRLDNTAPTDIVVTVICSNNADNPDVQVKWNYTLPFAEPSRMIPRVFGFLVWIISNQQSNKNVSTFLNDSETRSYMFSSTSLQQAGLEGDVITIVTVVTEVGRFHNNLTFSLEGIMTDISSTLMIRQCIDVSINQQCNESADSFQAVIQFADGTCEESRLNKTTENYTLQHDYETCIRVGTDPICFSAVIFHNNVEVARTGSQELILLQCNTSNISSVYNNRVTVTDTTTMGVVPQGTKVLHNTGLSFQCALLCTLMGANTTRCVNGTFESLQSQSSFCDCELQTVVIIAATTAGLIIIMAIIIIIIICFVYKHNGKVYSIEEKEARPKTITEVELSIVQSK